MTSIPMIDLFTIVFVLVDDWYKSEGIKLLHGKSTHKLHCLMPTSNHSPNHTYV